MRKALATVAGAILVLSACTSAPQPPPPLPPQAPSQPARPPHSSPPPPAPRDQCGAADLQHLVGRPRTEIPVPVLPARQRVACNTCPVTQDYSPARLNFFFDARTGLITEIRCG